MTEAKRLHHLSMRYVGAFAELAEGKPLAFLAKDHPGLREVRDLIDLVLITRAEINGLTRLLHERFPTHFSAEKLQRTFAEEYAYMTKIKSEFLGVEVSDVGLVFKNPEPPPSGGQES